MTKATLATRAAAGLCAALISAMSLVACGGEDSGAEEPVEETTELADDSADDSTDDADESTERRDREPATRDERRREPSERTQESETSAAGADSDLMSAEEFCVLYTRYQTKGVFAEADTPAGAQRAADHLDRLAGRAPGAIEGDVRLMARLFAEIAEANGDEDKLAEIDASELPETQKHLERWQHKHC